MSRSRHFCDSLRVLGGEQSQNLLAGLALEFELPFGVMEDLARRLSFEATARLVVELMEDIFQVASCKAAELALVQG